MAKETELSRAEAAELFRKAEGGDSEALERLKPRLESKLPQILAKSGLTSQVLAAISKRVTADGALATQFLMQREAELIAKDLAGPNPTPLESLLANQVSLCWMALQTAALSLEAAEEMTFKDAEWRQSRVESANRRFLAAVRTLAQVRRLQIPMLVQVNIDDGQVNIG